jgi:hypothetical protein
MLPTAAPLQPLRKAAATRDRFKMKRTLLETTRTESRDRVLLFGRGAGDHWRGGRAPEAAVKCGLQNDGHCWDDIPLWQKTCSSSSDSHASFFSKAPVRQHAQRDRAGRLPDRP